MTKSTNSVSKIIDRSTGRIESYIKAYSGKGVSIDRSKGRIESYIRAYSNKKGT